MRIENLFEQVVVNVHTQVMLLEQFAHRRLNFCGVLLCRRAVVMPLLVLLDGGVQMPESGR